MMAMWLATKIVSDDRANVGQGRRLQNHVAAILTAFNQIFTKMMQLGLATYHIS